MTWLLITAPLMLLGFAIAIVPVVIGMLHEHRIWNGGDAANTNTSTVLASRQPVSPDAVGSVAVGAVAAGDSLEPIAA